MNSHSFEFRADGSYTRDDISSVKGATNRTVLSSGASGVKTGTWKVDGFTIILSEGAAGAAERKMAFPWSDDDKFPPNRLYLGGTLLKRQK